MKKLLFIILLCFLAVFVVIAMPMSPHPGDSLEMILTVSDDVVMIQGEIIPAVNILHLESFNNEICLLANDEIPSHDYLLDSGIMAVPAVVYTDLEVEYLIEADIALRPENYRGGRLHYAVYYQQVI